MKPIVAAKRMIVDLPADVQMAIRLRAVKNHCTTGEVVQVAIEKVFPDDVRQAKEEIRKQH